MNANQTQFPSPSEPVYARPRRRCWLPVAGVCLLCAILAATGVWLGQVLESTAGELAEPTVVEAPRLPAGEWSRPPVIGGLEPTTSAYLRVAAQEPTLVFRAAETQSGRFTRDAFDIYKNTQAQLLRSRFVLTAAMREPEISKLRCVQGKGDPVGWLRDQLQVTFPGDAEIMEVSLAADDPQEVATLVNAVVEAYLMGVVDRERNQRRQRLSELDDVCAEKQEEVRNKLQNVRRLAETLGTGDSEALKLKQQMAVQRLNGTQREHFQIGAALRRAQGELKVKQALLEYVNKVEIPQVEVDVFSQSDPVASQLFEQLFALQKKLADVEASQADAPSVKKLKHRLETTQQELDARREKLRQFLWKKMRVDIETEIRRLEAEVEVLSDQERHLARDVEQQQKEIEQLSRSSVDLEMMRSEVERLNEVLSNVAMEREKLRVELGAAPRVTLIHRAEAPK